VLLHGGFNNRQTQSRTARFPVARLIGTVERTENLFAVFRADAGPSSSTMTVIPSLSTENANFNLRMRVAQGVTHDVLQRAFQRVGYRTAATGPAGSSR
jgi:hypothetical protein